MLSHPLTGAKYIQLKLINFGLMARELTEKFWPDSKVVRTSGHRL
jgi:hypothetical protein